MNQGDLFKIAESRYKAPEPEEVPFLDRYQVILRIDHTIIMCIFLMVLLTVVYAYGFERGRNSLAVSRAASTSSVKQVEKQKVSDKGKKELIIVNETKTEQSLGSDVNSGVLTQQEEILKQDEPIIAVAEKEVKAAESGQELIDKMTGKYTIQIVTYKTQKAAKKQIDELIAKGYQGFVIPSGSYHQVCVNTFDDRQTAKNVLKALQSKKLAPIDAYIRAMPV